MDDLDELRREFSRVVHFSHFEPTQRIWWIYMRNAALSWLESHEDDELREAVDRVKSFPENMPNEARAWHALRIAVGQVLER